MTTHERDDSAGGAARARVTVERIVAAVGAGDDRRIRVLVAELAQVADTATLLYLRERLFEERQD
ncbi:hypothetical protein ACIBTP_40965 [Streptomyces avidinii]|uniref:hypothetical protein n=1 Tax=Streptomyces TaxID=1883 RepID=UPI000F3AA847|nr:hypothetical protein [Streptomyces sp. ADI95-16]AYV26348.1 hypothetical protein EES41_06395 [Streptomyces sp. ADI95-16]